MSFFVSCWTNYTNFVKKRHPIQFSDTANNLTGWQNRLFVNLLTYIFPFSFVAAVPGILMSVATRNTLIGSVDTLCLLSLTMVVFSDWFSLKSEKIIIIGTFYFLAIFLTAKLGYIGPGIFYLFGITIFMSLIFPIRFGYWSIVANGFILLGFALIIHYQPFHTALLSQYSASEWMVFSSNLIFLSVVLVILIHRIFNGLSLTIATKDSLQHNYQSLFENSPSLMWLFDVETLRFLDVNEAAASHYGYTKAEFMNMTLKDVRPDATAGEIEKIVEANKNARRFRQEDMIHRKKNGEQIHVKIDSTLLDFNGRPAKLVLVTDITKQIVAEAEKKDYYSRLKESERNLLAIFDSSIDGFILLDSNCVIKTFNSNAKSAITLYNARIDFEIGKKIFDYVEQHRQPYFQQLLQRVLDGEVIEYDRKFRSKEHPPYWIHYALTPVHEDNAVIGVCITGRDVTMDKTYVQTIERQNKIFHEISWTQSHLVRAPLARIMALTTLLITDSTRPDKDQVLQYLQESSNELDAIIKEITLKTSGITLNELPANGKKAD